MKNRTAGQRSAIKNAAVLSGLSRVGESISSGKDIVERVEIGDHPIRPGIDPPREMRVLRERKTARHSRVRKP